jgi:hypothetical protein
MGIAYVAGGHGAAMGMDRVMRRRDFLTLIGGAAAWPVAPRGGDSTSSQVVGVFKGKTSLNHVVDFCREARGGVVNRPAVILWFDVVPRCHAPSCLGQSANAITRGGEPPWRANSGLRTARALQPVSITGQPNFLAKA